MGSPCPATPRNGEPPCRPPPPKSWYPGGRGQSLLCWIFSAGVDPKLRGGHKVGAELGLQVIDRVGGGGQASTSPLQQEASQEPQSFSKEERNSNKVCLETLGKRNKAGGQDC